jgi:2'-5' RNA ligase
MVQSVELLLDPAGERGVRSDWAVLLEGGLPSQGRIAVASNRPHITVAVAPSLDPGAERALAGTATDLAGELPIAVVLGGLVLFPGRRSVLARTVAPTSALLRIHRAFADVLAQIGPVPDTMLPGRWTPHVTLGRGLTGGDVGSAVALVGRARIDTAAVAVRRWDGAGRREWIIAGAAAVEGSTRG